MPLLRYFVYVGGTLLALLLVVNAYLPSSPAVETSGPHLPVIHIYADRTGPDRVVYDTSVALPAPPPNAQAGTPAQAAVVDVSGRVREAFAQLPPPDAGKVQPADAKKQDAKQPPPRKIAKRRTPPPVRMVDQQPQFGWFGPPQQRFW
jgi:hypothetical protein